MKIGWEKKEKFNLLFLFLLVLGVALEFSDDGFFAAGDDSDDDFVGTFVEGFLDLVSKFFVVWHFDIFTGVTAEVKKLGVLAIDHEESIILASDNWNVNVVGGWKVSFIAAASENVGTGDGSLGVTVLASLGLGNIDNAAWTAFKESITTLLKLVDWDGGSIGSTRIGIVNL